MKLLKFGGKSLANGKGINTALSIIENKVEKKERILIVLSARGNTTNELESLLDLARANMPYEIRLSALKDYQISPFKTVDLTAEFKLITQLLKGVEFIKDYSLKVKDLLLAQGELMAVKTLAAILNQRNIKCEAVDSRLFLKTDDDYGNAGIKQSISEKETVKYFNSLSENSLPIITGFIASNFRNETTTLGRNGSNYSVSLIANYLNVAEIESYTNVDGIFTANPEIVRNAKIIKHINYSEASELASFGANILHAKSILPLMEKKIPLRILNTFNAQNEGTLISYEKTKTSIKSISIQEEVALINITGKGLLGKSGIDARIFNGLSGPEINIGIISQGSSERGISFIIPKKDQLVARKILLKEFKPELVAHDIQDITSIDDISVITIVGQDISNFASSLSYLKQNKINILLINNTLNGHNISLVIHKSEVKKAVNVIHSQIFGAIKTINIAIVGKGEVGSSFINQILESKQQILSNKDLNLNIFAIAGQTKLLLNKDGISSQWKDEIELTKTSKNNTKTIIEYAEKHHLENLIAIDNTASEDFVANYLSLIENGFDLISSNKIANTQKFNKYKTLREGLKKHKKKYLYETNVGAGLPIIDTIKILHESGENITRIKGVFSGSLSYLFNAYSVSDEPFSHFLKNAIKLGYTEPDPREDLCGNDVARKLLILARELDLENEFDEIEIENLIPENLRSGDVTHFLESMESIDAYYAEKKTALTDGHVLRYVGDLFGNLKENKGKLKVELVSVPSNSALGNLKGSDSIFEIYTESYKENPITIIGAGAGAEVTARGVFGDLLRIADKK
jgi:aspartate kinase